MQYFYPLFWVIFNEMLIKNFKELINKKAPFEVLFNFVAKTINKCFVLVFVGDCRLSLKHAKCF